MADIIAIEKKMRLSKDKRAEVIRKRKILAVRKVFHCTHCASKCEKCGTQIGVNPANRKTGHFKVAAPYNLCESCAEEYSDYQECLEGRGDSEYYWHNQAWVELWKTWIDYQKTIDLYLKSNEFSKLLLELKQSEPNA